MITPLGCDQQTRSESQTVSSHFERAFEAIENIFILWSALFDFKCPYLQLSPKSSYLVLQNMKVPCQKCNFFWNQRIKERFFQIFWMVSLRPLFYDATHQRLPSKTSPAHNPDEQSSWKSPIFIFQKLIFSNICSQNWYRFNEKVLLEVLKIGLIILLQHFLEAIYFYFGANFFPAFRKFPFILFLPHQTIWMIMAKMTLNAA